MPVVKRRLGDLGLDVSAAPVVHDEGEDSPRRARNEYAELLIGVVLEEVSKDIGLRVASVLDEEFTQPPIRLLIRRAKQFG